MPRTATPTPTDAERRILEVLWARGEASVREVADQLSELRPVAYTTVLTLFKVLEKKGMVAYRTEGRAFVYRATISRTKARARALEQVLRQFFNGSPDALAQHLIDEHGLDSEEIAALRRRIDAAQDREASP
ncbi:BlaI/MecI/CopY family transcriptional regulator [Luteimonas sp. Y-2-2-4F]|nr:BlaI/MecI/CopY family transcriptional regulator [Luteimonas sp. Y-2-2-4F]MCD9031356.1 BlaI/MecI/CopY family transcriptional regulator [Luteimonas sp. Y-2-2-4F]